ncbi:MAG TPA: TRAP transporter small permease [Crenalkalicoccus sp.]|nr:TRAP transporter small permease [Crenalkalicoccus sp.]
MRGGRRDGIWDRIERGLIGALGGLAMLVGMVQVIGRYVAPQHAISWAEEVIVYLIVWGVMIASSQLVRTDGHVRPDLVLRALRPGAQRWVEAANCVVALVFSAGLVWYGWEIVDSALLLEERSSTGLEFPMWIYYLALPAGGALMVVRYAIRLYRYLFAFDPATMTVGHLPAHEMPGGIAPVAD